MKERITFQNNQHDWFGIWANIKLKQNYENKETS